jgi:hypothetical protein
MKLAFDIGDAEASLWLNSPSLALPVARTAVLAIERGVEVLLFESKPTGAAYCGKAVVEEVWPGDGAGVTVGFSTIDWFGNRVPRLENAAATDGIAQISDSEFDRVVLLGLAIDDFAETQAPGRRIDTYSSIWQQVFDNFAGACAITGRSVVGGDKRSIQIVPIRLEAEGGALHVGNFLALTAKAADAFSRYHLTVGIDFQLIVDFSLIDPELLERLNPDGRLTVPDGVRRGPDPQALAFHRQRFFERLGG